MLAIDLPTSLKRPAMVSFIASLDLLCSSATSDLKSVTNCVICWVSCCWLSDAVCIAAASLSDICVVAFSLAFWMSWTNACNEACTEPIAAMERCICSLIPFIWPPKVSSSLAMKPVSMVSSIVLTCAELPAALFSMTSRTRCIGSAIDSAMLRPTVSPICCPALICA